MEFCDLTIEVPGGQALTKQLDAEHLGLGPASTVIAAPSSPDGPTDALRCAQDFVSGDGPGGGVLARWDDRRGPAGSDSVVALAGVEGTVGGDAGDPLIGRDLVEQFGQHGRIAQVAGGELCRADFQRLLVNSNVDLAPDAPFGTAMLAGVPLPFALDLDPGASHALRRDADRLGHRRAPVLDPGLKATKSGYFWAVVSDDRGHGGAGPPIVLFHYAPGRGKEHPLKFLAGYQGRFLQCEAYQAYNALTEIARDKGPWQLVYCWTHVRRRFVKRFENEGSPVAEEMLRQIALLYRVEKAVRGKAAALRLSARREHATPVIAALKPWLEAQLSRIPQKSQLAEDIRYTLAHWPGLIRFLEDGTIELDTNPVENQIRPIALTRKNELLRRQRDRCQELGHARLAGRHLQDVRREPGRLHRRHAACHPRRSPAKPHRRPDALALQPAVKPRRIE